MGNGNMMNWPNMMQPTSFPQMQYNNPYQQQYNHGPYNSPYQPFNPFQMGPYNQNSYPGYSGSTQPQRFQPVATTTQPFTHNHRPRPQPPTTRRPQPNVISFNPNGRNNTNNNNIFDPINCGPAGAANRILGGNDTSIDEFPWMALLQYRNSTGHLAFACGGMLISKRYVLTAGHCIKGEIERARGQL